MGWQRALSGPHHRISRSHTAADLKSDILKTFTVSEYVRISTNSHDALVTRGGCWLIDERMGTGDVGRINPGKLALLRFLFTGKDFLIL